MNKIKKIIAKIGDFLFTGIIEIIFDVFARFIGNIIFRLLVFIVSAVVEFL
ncbi:hypothetical protein [Apilactobacillus ozensis]|uniref:Uncharacterized protein n=1 Tax=Apilactobacillus ozensis DSM 23829 = JCM 17196 TaxID=1423781 RepID=A0A0R2AM48_9LACO|nr:hypothetical protein [Apilactobacillus ozensis]KRM67538.1 hypothetical protein FD06_GL000689 [Apilactobacillus ozensis DSM 23829 = JCM 17196]MCK8607192.1 hypothetical protein [Apilactobacillus ozensis]